MPAAEGRATEIMTGIEHVWSSPARPAVACHGDLTPANLFIDGDHVWIVDYRWAGAGDPFEDLGSLVAHFELGEERTESLLAVYFGALSDVHRARLGLMSMAARYLAAMRELARGPDGLASVEAAERHVLRVVEDASGLPFERWLAAIA